MAHKAMTRRKWHEEHASLETAQRASQAMPDSHITGPLLIRKYIEIAFPEEKRGLFGHR
jgi:hypothetical protein